MTAIDPDVRAVLEQVDASVPAPGGCDVAFFRAMAEGSPGGPSPVTLAAVEDAVIPGPACRVPVRFYRPEPDGIHPAIVFVHGGGFILRGLPPACIHTTALDPLRDDGVDYAGRLRRAGVPAEHRDAAGLFHGFHFFADALPRAREEVTSELKAVQRVPAARRRARVRDGGEPRPQARASRAVSGGGGGRTGHHGRGQSGKAASAGSCSRSPVLSGPAPGRSRRPGRTPWPW